jgi:hypothetical protein
MKKHFQYLPLGIFVITLALLGPLKLLIGLGISTVAQLMGLQYFRYKGLREVFQTTSSPHKWENRVDLYISYFYATIPVSVGLIATTCLVMYVVGVYYEKLKIIVLGASAFVSLYYMSIQLIEFFTTIPKTAPVIKKIRGPFCADYAIVVFPVTYGLEIDNLEIIRFNTKAEQDLYLENKLREKHSTYCILSTYQNTVFLHHLRTEWKQVSFEYIGTVVDLTNSYRK